MKSFEVTVAYLLAENRQVEAESVFPKFIGICLRHNHYTSNFPCVFRHMKIGRYWEKHGIHLQSDSENSQFALDYHGIIAQASTWKACAQHSVLDDNNHHHQLSLYTSHWAQASFGNERAWPVNFKIIHACTCRYTNVVNIKYCKHP